MVVVLLDEVGLAEQSPHLPLKVLHKMLDEATPGEAVVGIRCVRTHAAAAAASLQ